MIFATLISEARRRAALKKSQSLLEAARVREENERARYGVETVPHCDQRILHAPGVCKYCDERPEWQKYRQIAGIAFTGTAEESGTDYFAPCPSTYFRSPEVRDHWGGNRKAR